MTTTRVWIAAATIGVLAFGVWFFLFNMWLTVAVTIVSYAWWVRGPRLFRFLLCATLVASLAVPDFLFQLHRFSERFEESGEEAISSLDAAGIYGFHGIMTAGGALFFPEVAKEAFHLQFSDGLDRTWESDFALQSSAVKTLVERQQASLSKKAIGASTESRVRWKRFSSVGSYGEARVMLALACYEHGVKTKKTEYGYDHTAWCWVSYPSQPLTTPIPGVTFHEGLFRTLENRRWFRPFRANWVWKTAK